MLLSRFLNDKKLRIRCKFDKLADKSASNKSRFAWLILFNFLSKIYIRNSLIFYLISINFYHKKIFLKIFKLFYIGSRLKVIDNKIFFSPPRKKKSPP
ncbi:Hypothetical cytosolic protein [Fusobacterium nucleatum subsp. nucleatum ATCC 25586]|uniref:Hypothetical cytosolic protein n=1 Tax=Fusobacterium nucleatum subsp. nucleatum (strain ATCC 25586 / DSM 15643 / BCRC 10681 / CIP 101130 / JCM 8532 / KCTC 2640 / LMG 13131 / VPI 4355) TaxID=190304 RepID=Q8RGV6_FUSNN|nr:Hypothetical cytosolic protein [Fusobacterium nucleatum subsp. nucleatum ATCC 25586]